MPEKAYLLSEIFTFVWYVSGLKFDDNNKSEAQYHTLKHIEETGLDLSPLHTCKDIFLNSYIFFYICVWKKKISTLKSLQKYPVNHVKTFMCDTWNLREPRAYCSLTLLLVLA